MAQFLPWRSIKARASGDGPWGARLCLPILLFVLCGVPSRRAHAASAYEGFDYPVGTPNNVWLGGSGLQPRRLHEFRGAIAAGSLSDPTGTLATSGNRVEGNQSTWGRQVDAVPSFDQEFWVSFLMRHDRESTGFTGLEIDGGYPGFYYVGEPGGGPGDNTLVIGQAGNDQTYASSGVRFEPNRDYFLVTRIRWRDGAEEATLFVNPAPGTAPPAAGADFSGLDFAPGRPMFRFIAATSLPTLTAFDEIRVGTSFAEVAPAVPEPGAAAWVLTALSTLALRRRPRRAPAGPR